MKGEKKPLADLAGKDSVTTAPLMRRPPAEGAWGQVLGSIRRLLRVRLAIFGVIITLGLILVALAAPLVAPHDPNVQDYSSVLQPPSSLYPLGTDNLGRDVLSRIIYGSRVSLQVGLVAVGLATFAGVIVGLVAGYWRGAADEVLMRIMDALYSFPAVLLALAITAALGPGLGNAMIAIGIVYIPLFARLTRGQVLQVREFEFVTATRAIGATDLRIIGRHIFPNIVAPVIVQASLSVSLAIIVEASLSFLGLGVQPPTATWGGMLRIGYRFLERAPWLALYPGAAIFVTVLGLNLLGDGLRVALDPRLLQRGKE